MRIYGVRTRLENRILKREHDLRELAIRHNIELQNEAYNYVRLYTPVVALTLYTLTYHKNKFFHLPFSYIKKTYNTINRVKR